MISAVGVTGGHLGAGLGVVELTVALHYVFETPRDILIWDVGHQCYPHKILTGRRDRIRTLRQGGGLSGFTKRDESVFDPFGAAHASTSISAGVGMAVAHSLSGDQRKIVCVIGDGALSAGLAYEGLNNLCGLGLPVLVILNDNDMSISRPTGGVARYLAETVAASGRREVRPELKRRGDNGAPDGRVEADRPGRWFEDLGFDYTGPIDGHDMDQLIPVLEQLRDGMTAPTLLHIVTEKGKGYAPAEQAEDKGHGVKPFIVATGAQPSSASRKAAPSYTRVFADSLIRQAERDPRIVGVTAAMPAGTGLDRFAKRFSDRFFDVGIAEQHAVTFAAGLAAAGARPFCAIYSTFLQRAYDQVIHDVALQNLPVRFAIDRAGLVGADGPTHAGSFDVTYLGCVPNMVLMAAADEAELTHMVATAAAYDEGPIAFRYPRGEGVGVDLPEKATPLPIGKGRIVVEGERIAILSLGTRLREAVMAADRLGALGFATTVADARFAKPLDEDLVLTLAGEHEMLVTIEEGSIGGFGSQVLWLLEEKGVLDDGLKVRSLILPDCFIAHDKPDRMYAQAGLDAEALVAKILELRRPDRWRAVLRQQLRYYAGALRGAAS